MTTMSAVWDRTVLILQGRGAMLARIAILLLFVPALVRAGAQALADPASPGAAALVSLIGLATVIVAVWGQLALIAAASDPSVMERDALQMGARRLPAAVGLALIAGVVIGLLFAPVIVVLARSGIDMQMMAAGNAAAIPPGIGGFIGLYTLAFLIVALFVGARLAVFYPVILLERTGIGAFARSFGLTRGLTWRILGVLLLYLVVILVASGAARLVFGSIAALVVGPGAGALFVAMLAAAMVTTIFGVIAAVFSAQLYVALRDTRPTT